MATASNVDELMLQEMATECWPGCSSNLRRRPSRRPTLRSVSLLRVFSGAKKASSWQSWLPTPSLRAAMNQR